MALGFALAYFGWVLFGERTIRDTITEAGTKALGTQLDIAELKIHSFTSTVELKGIALADPFDRTRNLFEIALVRLELEPKPLLEKKLVIKRLSVADVRTGTQRAKPAGAVTGPGFAPRALAEVRRFAQQFNVPLLSLTPFDTLKALALDPTKLKAVQAALSLAGNADTVKQAIDNAYAGLRLQQTVDSSAALVARLQNTNVRSLGIDGARRAVADLRRAAARVDSAKGRVEGMVTIARRGVDSLQNGLRAIDDARRDDYAFARSLLQLPSFDAPDIGSALVSMSSTDPATMRRPRCVVVTPVAVASMSAVGWSGWRPRRPPPMATSCSAVTSAPIQSCSSTARSRSEWPTLRRFCGWTAIPIR